MLKEFKKLIGKRIFIRPMTEADATETYASWMCDPDVNEFLQTKRATVPELRSYIAQKNAQPNYLFCGVFLNDNSLHIGTIRLDAIDLVNGKANIGIMIGDKRQWGQGFGAEAMQLLIDYCFDTLRFREIELGVLAQNRRAVRAYENLGFKEIRHEPKSVHYENGTFDQIIMAKYNHHA